MASLVSMRPLAAPTEAACCLAKAAAASRAHSWAQHAFQRSSRKLTVTFLINLPWGGTSVASVPLEDLPLLSASEAQKLAALDNGASAVERLATSTSVQASACGLYVPGHFLLSFAAARAGFRTPEAASKLRLVVQEKDVYPHTCLPLEAIIGAEAGVALAVDRAFASPEAAESNTKDTSPGAALCTLWLLLRLPGGKGGFGALLKKQRRTKRANFSVDACRDLTGRRIRQAQVVTRIKAWMEKKRKEDALVAALTQGAPEKVPEAKPTVALDDAFMSEQLACASEASSIVAQGLKQQEELRKKLEQEQRRRAARPQNRALFSQLRDAVEVDSDDELWSDTDAGEPCEEVEHDSTTSSSRSSSSDTFSAAASQSSATAAVSSKRTHGRTAATSSRSALEISSDASKSKPGPAGDISAKKSTTESPKADTAAAALMQQLEQMRLKASAEREKELQRQAEAAAEAARAAALAEKAAAEAAEKVAREAQQLDVSRFNTAEELAKAVDAAVVKEKLRQLGWKCGGRPEERAARLFQLKTVDLSNVPKALLARPPSRMA
ncbi:hypothetical protein, conserved [Eimeria praecox]|uniref:Uncharacterized protein n=1 Tax=Eimeria praecox TaxID=51316 RepID=U6H0A5_9EIME|nr:hypothetical protein, conserved [Eimeria praecox]